MGHSSTNNTAVNQKTYTQQPNSSHRMSKLDINSINNISQNASSMRATEDMGRAHTSHATKTFDNGVRNQTSVVNIREHKNEPVRRKLNNNTANSTSTTTRRMGDELRRIGLAVTELPKIKEDEKNAT